MAQEIYYEGEIFKLEEQPTYTDEAGFAYYKVINYDDVMNKYFSTNGIKSLETDKGNKGLFRKINGVMYCAEGGSATAVLYESVKVGNIKQENNKIEAEIKCELNEYLGEEVVSKVPEVKTSIVFLKENNSWKIDKYEIPEACYERYKNSAISY